MTPLRIADALLYITGLAIATMGLLNVLPAYGPIPRIGPFPIEWFRPVFFWGCMAFFLLTELRAWLAAPNGPLKPLVLLVAALVLTWLCYDFYRLSMLQIRSIFFFTTREMVMALAAAALVFWACWRLWGPAIAILGAFAVFYLATGPYWPGILRTASFSAEEIISMNVWYGSAQGILGEVMGIVLTTVLPFIVLGSLLEGVGAGNSLIRVSFQLLSRFRGGPAYAAVTSSALFGTISGSAVANVVGTGVVTIPMILRRGFTPSFAGAVEATASTGGQILPPIMGAAALVMADFVGVSYVTVMTAALLPALAYYASLFISIYFESGRLGITQTGGMPEEKATLQDWLNLVLVFGPVVIVVALLLYGLSPAGASIAAIIALVPLSFINADVRRRPVLLLNALANGGQTVAGLAIAVAVIGIIVATMSATGVPTKFSVLLSAATETSLFAALLISALGCIVLGMGMPTLPAYIAIVVVMGPTLQRLGLEPLTAHMFVFFFGVASAITPPVAIAAYAAAAIAKGRPLATSVECLRLGGMIFLIPFAFAFNPDMLLGDGAGTNEPIHVASIFLRLLVALYLSTTALIGFDKRCLHPLDRLLRVGAMVMVLTPIPLYFIPGLLLTAGLALVQRLTGKTEPNALEPGRESR